MSLIQDNTARSVPLRSPLLCEDDFRIVHISDDEFAQNPSDWEKIFECATGANTKMLRLHLLNILRFREIRSDRKDWFLHRWRHCLFDSISDRYFLMTEIFVPTAVSSEKMEPFLKCEDEGYSDLGRKDVTYLDLNRMTWGISGNTQLIREKLNGVHVERVLIDGHYNWAMLGMLYRTTESPTELLEWTEDGMYGLFPYGVPDHTVAKVKVIDHRWQAPSPHMVSMVEEGIMLLQGDKELRLKRVPTIEVAIVDEIWEVGLDDVGLHRVRPRYGKRPMPEEQLNHYPVLDDLRTPVVSYHVNYTVTGPYVGKYSTSRDVITIDSGYRLHNGIPKHIDEGLPVSEVTDVLMVENIYFYIRDGLLNSGPQISEMRSKSGAKAIVYDQDGIMHLIKDGLKPCDYVGGTISYGEAPIDALIREIWEETGSRVTRKDMAFLGISTGYEGKEEWHTYLYVMPCVKIKLDKFVPMSPSVVLQPWVERIRQYVADMIGNSCHSYFMLHSTIHPGNASQSQIKVIESLVSQVVGHRIFHTGPDLMHAIYKSTSNDSIDFTVLKVVLSLDLKIIPFINVMCNHKDQGCECSYVMVFAKERRPLLARQLVQDLTNWIVYISSNYKLMNGVPVKITDLSVQSSLSSWVKKDDCLFSLRKKDGRGVCFMCKLVRNDGYWFVRSGGQVCPKCYVRSADKAPYWRNKKKV